MILRNDLLCGKNMAGCTLWAQRVICLTSGLPLRETKKQWSEPEVLYHELEHVVTGHGFATREMTGHQAITALEPMGQMLGENPQLANYFVEAAGAR